MWVSSLNTHARTHTHLTSPLVTLEELLWTWSHLETIRLSPLTHMEDQREGVTQWHGQGEPRPGLDPSPPPPTPRPHPHHSEILLQF